ncbi:MAG: acylphosphatase [Hyphomicrobiaceae bacterium]|nr:acylphosphatase [Hyphomicrobiaceae bacterium]
MARAVHVNVTGRVQGVGYRAWCARVAESLGLAGWVRNLADGSVEAVLSGPDEAVAAQLSRMGQGPSHARVDDVCLLGEAALQQGPFRILKDG